MVNTTILPAELEPTIDRPNGRSFFMASQLFYLDNSDLFTSPEALVTQATVDQLHHTVMVDVSDPAYMFRWQLVTAGNNGRTVTELQVARKGEVSGWTAQYTSQGALANVGVIDENNWQQAGNKITQLINSEDLEKKAAQERSDHVKNEVAMANFMLTGKLGDLKLYRKAYEKENARLSDRLKKFGFSVVKFQQAPVK